MIGVLRLLQIIWTLSRYRVDLPYLKWLNRLLPVYYGATARSQKSERLSKRLSLAFEALGPVWIKLGQLLSTRRDLLPKAWVEDLKTLQDCVHTGVVVDDVEALVAKKLGDRWQEALVSFESEPMAAASIAQVHGAVLRIDEQLHAVVVKVIKPTVGRLIKKDMRLLYVLARMLRLLIGDAKRLRVLEVVAEVESTLYQELDLIKEAGNASVLKRHFQGQATLHVPTIYWDFCCKEVMVSERVEGIRIDDIAALKAAGVDLKKLAKMGLDLFFTQVFEHRFFHADMHPGNVWVQHEQNNTRYAVMDFGIMGTLNDYDQRYLAENLLAFFNRDYRRVAELHVESGWVPQTVRLDAFEAAIRGVCEPIFARPLKDISFGTLLLELFRVARTFKTTIQPQLILLQKTLVQVESLGRHLDPELNLWETAHPFLESWVASQVGVKGFLRKSMQKWPYWLERMPDLPDRIYALLEKPVCATVPLDEPEKRFSGIWLGAVLGLVVGLAMGWLWS